MSNSLFKNENMAIQLAQLTSSVRGLHQLLNQSLMQVTQILEASCRTVQTPR